MIAAPSRGFLRWMLLIATLGATCSCQSGVKECGSDLDCRSGSYCHASLRVCFEYGSDAAGFGDGGRPSDGGSGTDGGPGVVPPSWVGTGEMTTKRQGSVAALLSNGKVLVAGGWDGTKSLLSAELFDPTSGTWTATGSLVSTTQVTSATLLPSGKVLLVGLADDYTSRVELYNPVNGSWSQTGVMARDGEASTATLLHSGKVLVVGGYGQNQQLASAQLYDPSTGTWTSTGSMASGRYGHTATLLANGKVLAVGGNAPTSAELFDTSTGTARIIYRRNLAPLGWALGGQVRESFAMKKEPS